MLCTKSFALKSEILKAKQRLLKAKEFLTQRLLKSNILTRVFSAFKIEDFVCKAMLCTKSFAFKIGDFDEKKRILNSFFYFERADAFLSILILVYTLFKNFNIALSYFNIAFVKKFKFKNLLKNIV